ncbi:aminotransferase class I/II-fold pyridoxal phosphate-dependent enzyme [Oceanobacillus sp. FSL W7-1309]|uniref:aminotransferase class I/II-fold pyridoxal phosphate-dependent enzyme n=1 Tax=Oceanobacillus sp. FSL W7-1309 TaxID=2954539 RepID=UPI0030F718FA
MNLAGREQLYRGFKELGLDYIETMDNFILVELGLDAKGIYQQLLAKGVIVRYGDIWRLPDHIHVSIGTWEENQILIEAMRSIF